MTVQNAVMQKALEERKRLEQEQEIAKSNKGNFTFDPVEYLALENGVEKIFRILGNPAELRSKPTDPKRILTSKILRDDSKGYLKVIWPWVEKDGKFIHDPEFIITKLFNKVNEGKWEKYEDGHTDEKGKNGQWKHFHKDTNIFKRIAGNAKQNEKFPPNFYPSQKISFNLIDRHDSWCKDNKHSKLPTSSKQPFTYKDDQGNDQTIHYTEFGVPKTAYDKIFDHYAKFSGFWEDTDCILVKTKTQPWYEAWDKADSRYISQAAVQMVSDLPLTEEEKAYELYDLDIIFKPTSYAKIKKHLTGLFKQCDLELGTAFYDELVVLAEKEAKERAANQAANNTPIEDEDSTADMDFNGQTTDNSSPVSNEQPQARPRPTANISDNELAAIFPNWGKLKAEEQTYMKSIIIKIENGAPQYIPEADNYYCGNKECKYPGTDIKTIYPGNVNVCPVCGAGA